MQFEGIRHTVLSHHHEAFQLQFSKQALKESSSEEEEGRVLVYQLIYWGFKN